MKIEASIEFEYGLNSLELRHELPFMLYDNSSVDGLEVNQTQYCTSTGNVVIQLYLSDFSFGRAHGLERQIDKINELVEKGWYPAEKTNCHVEEYLEFLNAGIKQIQEDEEQRKQVAAEALDEKRRWKFWKLK